MLFRGITNKIVVIFFQGISLLTLPLLAKYIGDKEYGIWSIIFGMMQMLVPVLILQLDSGFTRFLSGTKSKEKISNIFLSILTLLILILAFAYLFFYVFDEDISKFMFASESYDLYVFITISWVSIRVISTFSRNFFRTFSMFKTDTTIGVIQQLTVIISILIVTYLGKGLIDFFKIILTVELLLLFFTLLLVSRELFFTNLKFNIPNKFFLYSLPLIPTMILAWVTNYSDQLMIVHFSGLEENARYSLYYVYSRIPHWIVITPLNYALFPFLSKCIYSGKGILKVNSYIKESINVSILIISLLIIGLIFYGSEILNILSDQEINSSSILLIILISFSVFASAIYQISYNILSLKNKNGVLLYIFGSGALFNLVFNYYTIPIFGIIGAAFSTLLSFVIVSFLTVYESKIAFKDLMYSKTVIYLTFILSIAIFMKFTFFNNLYILGFFFLVILTTFITFINRFFPAYFNFIKNYSSKKLK
ncbi:oligosaccharide flippase family protein [bacterium]|nr:oligosaccharide flippase family protein [bacterium]